MPVTLDTFLGYNAGHFPGRLAMSVDGHGLTFSALAAEVESASRLLGSILNRGDRLAIWLPNGCAWSIVFLAAARLGMVVVPISTRLTAFEADGLIQDCGARLLVTTRHYRGRSYFEEAAGLPNVKPILMEADEHQPASQWRVQQPADVPHAESAETPLLCIQYTSGTTARPKGVMIAESAYIETAAYTARCQRLTPATAFASAAPFFHCSGSMHAITVTLVAGCTLHTLSNWDPEALLDLVNTHQCTASHGIFWKDVLDLGAEFARPRLQSMKVASAIGSVAYMSRLRNDLGLEGVASLYGLTETCGNYSMWYPDDPFEKRSAASGRPQPSNLIRTVEPGSTRICEADVAGEIQLRGSTVTSGYFKRPVETAEAFTADGWFKTGDLGKLSSEGEITYVGRLKEIVRVGGENVSPLEIEEVLQEISGIQQLCVIGIPDARLGESLAVVMETTPGVPWCDIEAAMALRLSKFKIPQTVYRCASLPRTAATNRIQRGVIQRMAIDGTLEKVN